MANIINGAQKWANTVSAAEVYLSVKCNGSLYTWVTWRQSLEPEIYISSSQTLCHFEAQCDCYQQ